MSKTAGLALLIAIGALGLGIYQIAVTLGPSEENIRIRNVWYAYHSSSETTWPTSADIWIDELLINFTVNPGESVLFLFSAQTLVVYGSSLYIHFPMDGEKIISFPFLHIIDDQSNTMMPVSFHFVSNTISPGNHNVSVIIHGDNFMNEISRSSLLIQTFV
jgi:hypothetical protein